MTQRQRYLAWIQKVTESIAMDVVGVTIVVTASLAMGYHLTVINGLPIGVMSTVGAAFSMMATRLVTKRNNTGNLIGILTTVNTAFVDYYLGNQAAMLTYPISFLGNMLSYAMWKRRKERTPRKLYSIYFINTGIACVLAFGLNYVGFTDFLSRGLNPDDMAKFYVTTAITCITFSGTLNMPRMYADSWAFWQGYNVLKLYQNVLFGNVAYVAKYIFYLFNALFAWIVWHKVRREAEVEPINDQSLSK
jgi:nicotinamide mononucleotide transporter PnuC